MDGTGGESASRTGGGPWEVGEAWVGRAGMSLFGVLAWTRSKPASRDHGAVAGVAGAGSDGGGGTTRSIQTGKWSLGNRPPTWEAGS